MPSSTSIPIIVEGNTLSLAIPLQIYQVVNNAMVLQSYTPAVTDVVTIQLKSERRQYTYTPSITDNTAYITLDGTEKAGNYGVVVNIVRQDNTRLRSFRTDQFFIVEASDNLTADDITAGLENNVIYLNAQAFVAGEAGKSRMYIGSCDTAKATANKVCSVEPFPTDNGQPLDGTLIGVKFSATDTSTSTSPTINVNNTGDKRIWYNDSLLATAKSSLHHGYAGRYIFYFYDSSLDSGNGAWVWLGCGYDTNTTYTNVALGQGYATDTRSSAVTAVTASLSSYTLTVGGIVAVKFAYDVPANATLNINSKGAKAIYNRDAPITAGVIKAGDTATFIYTTYYRLISLDRSEGGDMSNYYTKSEIDAMIGNVESSLASI